MDQARDEAINKLITGQEKMILSVSELQESQTRLEAGQNKLEVRQEKLEARQEKMSNDITELKTSQNQFENLLNTVLGVITRLEKIVVVNIENDLRTKVHTLFDANLTRQHEVSTVNERCNKHEKRLDNHEVRILRQERS